MSVLTNNMSDIINISDRAIMEEIAKTDDHPVLMINQNLYTAKAEFPDGELYKRVACNKPKNDRVRRWTNTLVYASAGSNITQW